MTGIYRVFGDWRDNFEEDNSFVFEIKDIKQTPVLLDKANFYHAGWFKFELYADGKLIEKNKFKISKDF